MFASLLLIIEALVPTGAYSMPALCKTLTTITGVPHEASALLVDYPVFVSIKNGDPKRVEKLVAIALHGEWVSNRSNTITLRPKKREKDQSFEAFKAMYLEATKADARRHSLPVEALYALAPGEILRFSSADSPYARKFVTDPPTSENHQNIIVRRQAPGYFEFGLGDREVGLSGVPLDVKQLLGDELRRDPFPGEVKAQITKTMGAVINSKLKWDPTGLQDPIATLHSSVLKPLAAAISCDLVMALPDISIFAVTRPNLSTVESALGQYSVALQWTTADSAVIGTITQCELDHPSQCKRDVLRTFLEMAAKNGVISAATLADYVADQRPAASETWTDAMMLALSGAVIDQEYIGDYPFNVRLYTSFDQEDWVKLKSNMPFTAEELSSSARSNLLALLIQSRARIEKGKSDPAYWQTLDFNQLTVTPKLEETPVLIGFTMVGGEVTDLDSSARNFELRRKSLDHEPTYQVANRRRLVLKVSSPKQEEFVETGFSEVSPVGQKALTWRQLPNEMMLRFKKVMEETRKQQQGLVAIPPPRP